MYGFELFLQLPLANVEIHCCDLTLSGCVIGFDSWQNKVEVYIFQKLQSYQQSTSL